MKPTGALAFVLQYSILRMAVQGAKTIMPGGQAQGPDILRAAVRGAQAALERISGRSVQVVPGMAVPGRRMRAAVRAALGPGRDLVRLTQPVSGCPDGADALTLLVSGKEAARWVRRLRCDPMAVEALTDIEREALTELANVLLNTCFIHLAERDRTHLPGCGLPIWSAGTLKTLVPTAPKADPGLVLPLVFTLDGMPLTSALLLTGAPAAVALDGTTHAVGEAAP